MKTLKIVRLLCKAAFLTFLVVFSFAARAGETKKVIIPFDFVSKFDDGRYGAMMADAIWTKLNREGGFIVPDSTQEVRDFCKSHHLSLTPDMALEKIKKIVREDFDAQIGIWGSVERAPGEETDVYDLIIECVDFSDADGPKTIYEVKARTKTVSEIPHIYVKALLDALYGRKSESSSSGKNTDKLAAEKLKAERWKTGPNLVVGGDFEGGAGGVPRGWEKVAGQQREPLGNLVKWASEKNSSQHGSNKFIRFTFDSAVGDNEGVMYYSDYFPVEEGALYRFECRFRSSGPAVKVFLKCYDDTKTEYQNGKGQTADSLEPLGAGQGSKKNLKAENSQRREVYRCQMKLEGPKNTWNTHSEDFTPRHTKYSPQWGRVMLYAYLGAGQVDFDDVVVKQILPPPYDGSPKELKHSSATKVTIKEMEENEQRSKEAK